MRHTVKAWALLYRGNARKVQRTEPTYKLAKAFGFPDEPVVPCTITYELPKRKKAKK